MSMYGEGDPPDNAVNFCSGLEKMWKRGTKLTALRCLAMGMGNKNYKHYNQVIKVSFFCYGRPSIETSGLVIIQVVDETLSELGAQQIGPVGCADESLRITEESFMDWKEEILGSLRQVFSLEERLVTYELSIDIVDVCIGDHHVYLGELSEKALYNIKERVAYNARNPYPAPIVVSRKLSSIPDRNCVHMEFNLSAVPALRYQTGDHLAVWPVNPDSEVERLIRLLDLDDTERKKPVEIHVREVAANNKPNLPSPTTREALLKYYLGIGAPVSRNIPVLLIPYTSTRTARETLARLSKDKNASNEVAARYLTVGKIMERVEPNVKWTQVPFSLLVESFNRIQPRYYSISSSPVVQPRQLTITMVVNNHQTSKGDRLFGLATNFLLEHDYKKNRKQQQEAITDDGSPSYDLNGPRNKLIDSKVYIHVKRSTFKLPPNPTTPIIVVGAGTGIAPFRGFIQERAGLAELGKPIGKMVLIFGCRDDTSDHYLYRSEWESFQRQLGIENFIVLDASSRSQKTNKTYVQDVLVERKDIITALVLEHGAASYICGAAATAREVGARLVEILNN